MKILLTGGTGFLGTSFMRHIVLQPRQSDFEVTIVSSGRTKLPDDLPKNVKIMQLDLTQRSTVEAFEGLRFDTVLHFATTSTLGPSFSELERFRDINQIDNIVLDIVKTVRASHVIWASSGAVYGKISTQKQTNELHSVIINDLFNERSYRIGKIQSEYHAVKFAEAAGIKLDILRLFTFSGVNLPLNAHFALGNFIDDALRQQCINIYGTGLARRSYLDQNDFAEIILRLLNAPPEQIRVLNVGSPEELSLKTVANVVQDIYLKKFGKKPTLIIHNRFDDKDNYYVPDTTLLEKTFPDFTFKTLANTVEEMITYVNR